SRADELSAVVRQEASSLNVGSRHLVGRTDSFAEVLDSTGKVIDSSLMIGKEDLLDADQLRAAADGPVFIDRGPLPGLDEGSRLLAVPVSTPGGTEIVVVGSS